MSEKVWNLIEEAEGALRFIEKYSDVVDGDYGVPEPNEAMSISIWLASAIKSVESELNKSPAEQHQERLEEVLQWNR